MSAFLTNNVASQEDIILDWLGKQPRGRFDDRVNPEALLELISAMRQFGYTKDQLKRNSFIDEVINNVCHDHTPKAPTWKKITRKKIKLAVARAFPLPVRGPTEEEIKRFAESTISEEDANEIVGPKPTQRVYKPVDTSGIEKADTTPVDEDSLLKELGIKRNE